MANHPNARVSRSDEERRERRRRHDGTLDRINNLALAIPPEVVEANPGYNFRWINDDRNRIHEKTQLDDWDVVESVDARTVGTDREGRPLKAYLCKKPTEFCIEDAARKEADLKEQEMGLIQGNRDAASKQDLPDTVAYVPDGKNNINRGLSRPT